MTDRACYSNCSSLNLTTCSILTQEEPDVDEGKKGSRVLRDSFQNSVQYSMTRMAATIPRNIWLL